MYGAMFVMEKVPFQIRGHTLYEKEDFSRLMPALSNHWWYYLDELGEGQAVDFPVKIKPIVTWTSLHFIWENNQLKQAPRIPQEKLCVTVVRRCCNIDNLLMNT